MKTKEERMKLVEVLIIIIIILLFILGCNLIFEVLSKDQMINQPDFIANLEVINSNCGSTFLTHRYGSSGWYVFTEECKGEYCKSVYIELGDCLK